MNSDSVISYLASRNWAMDPQHLQAMADLVSTVVESASAEQVMAASEQAAALASERGGYDVRDGVAHIAIEGPMLKEIPCGMGLLGIKATSTRAAREAVEEAALDPMVKAIALDVDSPGGSVEGVKELADAVHAARDLKRVDAYVSGLAASAALWVASQAHAIEASPSSMVGSIGALSVIRDSSEQASSKGIKVHVIRSSELKGGPVDGAPVTDAQIAERQRIVNEITAMFVGDVARGRGLSEESVRELATGQAWFAASAADKRLVDSISTSRTKSASAAGMVSTASTSPLAGASEDSMADNATTAASAADEAVRAQLAAAQDEAAKLRAEAELARAALAEARAQQREQLFAKYQDRLSPAMKGLADTLAEACGDDLARLEANLKSLPVVTRAEPQGATPEQPSSVASLSSEDKAVCELFGIAEDVYSKLLGAKSVEAHTGKVVFADGTVREVK